MSADLQSRYAIAAFFLASSLISISIHMTLTSGVYHLRA